LSERVRSGDPAAEFELANAFFAGKDIPKDESKGAALLERAARDGVPEAQFQMAVRAYGSGSNPETYVSAYVWYSLAQRSGFGPSQGRAETIAAEMTPEQLAEARKQLEKFAVPAPK
jgi:TPR repeat protein